MKKLIILFFLSLYFISCSTIIPMFIKKKKASSSSTELATIADAYFWKHFHEGNYDSIPKMLNLLKAAYIEDPNNATIVAHIGFTHAWAGSERIRATNLQANIIDHYSLANKYFKEAFELNPKDIRLLGFHGDFLMAEGNLAQDKRKTTKGYFQAKKVSKQWPEWGAFTLSYVLSLLDKKDKRFQESIELMWHNADVCACEKVDRKQLDWSKYYPLLQTNLKEKNRRACWNSWIAPHNLEGFFIHFGDILVKSGNFKDGIMMYQNAKTSPDYETYPYKTFLEQRIKNAEQNVKAFNNYNQGRPKDNHKILMIDSKISCMGCHQKQQYISPEKTTSYLAPHLQK